MKNKSLMMFASILIVTIFLATSMSTASEIFTADSNKNMILREILPSNQITADPSNGPATIVPASTPPTDNNGGGIDQSGPAIIVPPIPNCTPGAPCGQSYQLPGSDKWYTPVYDENCNCVGAVSIPDNECSICAETATMHTIAFLRTNFFKLLLFRISYNFLEILEKQ